MPAAIPIAASVAGAAVSGMMNKSAAGDAAQAQVDAANASSATQRYMYDQSRADRAPWLQTGTAGLNRLAYLMGIDQSTPYKGMTEAEIRNELAPKFTQTGGSTLAYDPLGGISGITNAPSVIDEQGLAQAIQQRMAQQLQEKTAYDAQQVQMRSSPDFGSLTREFTNDDFVKDPGYQFRLDEGLKALQHSAAARGGLLSGNALKGISRYGQDYASNEFGNAFNRFNTNQTNKFNRFASLAGIGQTSANLNANNAMQLGEQIGNNQIGAGNARASGYIGGSNALTGAIGQGVNALSQYYMMNQTPNYSGYQPPSYGPMGSYSDSPFQANGI